VESLREWAAVIATTLLGIVAAYFSYSYGRQLKLSLASRRLAAYSKLFQVTGLAAPTRLDERTGLAKTAGALDRSLTESERRALFEMLTTWYYTDGNGMLLTKVTRNVYLSAKHNLVCEDTELDPIRFRVWLQRTKRIGEDGPHLSCEERGCYSIRQLSLLRTQMKTDLAIYGLPYTGALYPHELEFLRGCGVDLRRKPWRDAPRADWSVDPKSADSLAKNCGPAVH
jgi:hypothetical protein